MNAERWLQIHVVALCVLGSIFIAAGSNSYLMPAGLIAAGSVAVMFTDAWKWFRLNRLLANAAAMGAVAYSLQDFVGASNESQLMAIANLLIYLEVVLFFQEKNPRIYWQIILLSLLQVVIGAALELGVAFGGLVVIYSITVVSTLIFLFVYQSLAGEDDVEKVDPAKARGKWSQLIGSPPEPAFDIDRRRLEKEYLGPSLLGIIVSLATSTILFAGMFFYIAPRHPQSSFSGSRQYGAESGLGKELTLQQMGKLKQNNRPVMQVRIKHPDDSPYLLRESPYFLGEVMSIYRSSDRRAAWSVTLSPGGTVPLPPAPGGPTAIQQMTMEPMPGKSLYAVMPAFKVDRTQKGVGLTTPAHTPTLEMQPDALPTERWSITLGTTGIQQGKQAEMTPQSSVKPSTYHSYMVLGSMIEECLEFDESRFPGIKYKADEIVRAQKFEKRDPVAVGRALESHFTSSGLYKYSLDMNIERDPNLDPIEDFVMNHRTGHCQYFSAALAMMLRSQGIPARLAVGYRGDEYNELGGYYQVRQRHAHAWVEAFLKTEEIPEYEVLGGAKNDMGAWLRLDPTPAADGEAATSKSWLGTARDWLDYGENLWNEYVVGLNQTRQKTTFQRALRLGQARDPAADWFDRKIWAKRFDAWASQLGFHFEKSNGSSGSWMFGVRFDWRAAVTAMVVTVLGYQAFCLLRWLNRRFALWTGLRRRNHARLGPLVRFYARLETILARHGYHRRTNETAREFAQSVERRWSETADASRITGLLDVIVEAFQKVRFGQASLSEDETSEIEAALAELEGLPRVQTADASAS